LDKDLADQVAGIAARVVASGAISANGHGNVSVRVPGAEEMYFTAGPSLRGHPASAVVRVGLDGTLLEGELPPIQGAVIPGVPAVLLANHGVLVFHRTPDLAILVGGVVEEAAQASMNAAALGGPVEIPPDLRAAALQRAMTFDSQGTVRA
jgi:ribulose-5-phosphate 4-epimerase/fuculose-1-phosphate aldolase